MEKALRYLPVSGTVLAVGTLLGVLIYKGAPLDWPSGVALVLIAGFGFVIAATLRFAVGQLSDAPTAGTQDALRGRLAPLVIGIGTVGILVVAIAVLIGIGQGDPKPDAGVYLGIFSSVVPVFATWVGAVIAFFFSNESFRQAAEASGAVGTTSDTEPITSPTRMIPFEKITSLTLGKPPKSGAPDLPLVLDDVPMSEVVPLFTVTVSRVIVFDAERRPLAIVRGKRLPTPQTFATYGDYRKADENAADAVSFRAIPENATVGDARILRRVHNVLDLFVTPQGSLNEPVKGWVPDDKLL